MSVAYVMAIIPAIGRNEKMTVAAAKEEKVCPDGKEKSFGSSIIVLYFEQDSKGLLLRKRFFNSKLMRSALKRSAIIPVLAHALLIPDRYRNAKDSTQMPPRFPVYEIIGMTLSPRRDRVVL